LCRRPPARDKTLKDYPYSADWSSFFPSFQRTNPLSSPSPSRYFGGAVILAVLEKNVRKRELLSLLLQSSDLLQVIE
ncbi:hypothetical protein LINGRAHAP2_LOCUS30092, partial [Linum grandiflorum]